VAILNHNKQHAWGNILTLLYLGLKVFLNEKNPIYTYLINLNVVVFEMNSLSQENLDNKLTQIFVERNRKILNSNFGSEKVFQQTSLLINELVT
jgi:dTDP-N-acetylfucosamine:lipid II N-acetylfucosaminyltransferase